MYLEDTGSLRYLVSISNRTTEQTKEKRVVFTTYHGQFQKTSL